MAEADERKHIISHYEGLETIFRENLKKCDYKSDVVMVFAHFLLTQELNYEFVKIDVETETDDSKKNSYILNNLVLSDVFKLNSKSYKLIYKNGTEVRILSGQKNNRELVLYLLTEEGDSNKITSPICLQDYIPNSFLKSNDISLIDNLDKLNDTLCKFFTNNNKIKNKKKLDEYTTPFNVWDCKIVQKERKGKNSGGNYAGFSHGIQKKDEEKGKFYLQEKDKHKPSSEINKIDPTFKDDPNYYMVECPDGPPDESYIT